MPSVPGEGGFASTVCRSTLGYEKSYLVSLSVHVLLLYRHACACLVVDMHVCACLAIRCMCMSQCLLGMLMHVSLFDTQVGVRLAIGRFCTSCCF